MSKNVSKEQAFWFCNNKGWIGHIAHNIEEFSKEIRIVPVDSLDFHLREGKNDFESWMMNVMQEKRLAKKMTQIKRQGLRGEDLRKTLISLFE